MPRKPNILLRRFPLVETPSLSVARRETSRFWPRHESRVVGPERYAVVMNRVLLGDIAITFAHCTARVRVSPLGPSREGGLILPLEGVVEIETDAGRYQATPEQPLFRAPVRLRRFESTPARCLMVDVPVATLRSVTCRPATNPPLRHVILRDDDAATILAQAIGLSRLVDRSRGVRALQSRSGADRRRLLPRPVRHAEMEFIESLARAVSAAVAQEPSAIAATTSASVEDWLRRLAFSGLPIAAVARRAGLSVRGLQRACASRGYTPIEFMRSVQLDRAQELLATATQEDTVAAVAHAVGVAHLGRFSCYYRRRFGEAPSATFRRALQSVSPGAST